MKAVIYSRFSTDNQNESSIDDQVRICTEFSEREGMTIVRRYQDEGISGAAFGNRPEFNAMRAAAMAGEFGVLLVLDTTRLSRSQELAPLIDVLRFNQVRVIGIQDNFDSSVGTSDMQAGISGIMSVEFRKMVTARTHAALETRAMDQRPTGGRCYGYRTVPTNPEDPDCKKQVEIVPQQAKIVRDIFAMYIDGASYRTIAAELNSRGVPSPGSNWKRVKRRSRGWMGSGVRAMVLNIRYTGLIRWNTSQWVKDPDTGKRIRRKRPESEWLRYDDESLRIISDETFKKALRRARDAANPDERLKCGGKPKYLLSGLLKCKYCGSNYILTSSIGYQCSGNVGGACGNNVRVRRDVAETKILGPIRDELLAPERVDRMAREIEARLMERVQELSEKSTPAEIQALDARIERLHERLSAGDPDLEPDELQLAINAAQRKRLELVEAQPEARHSAKIIAALPKAAEAFKQQIERGLGDNPREANKARVILKDLLGPIQMCPGPDGSLWAEFYARPAALLKKAVGTGVGSDGSGGAFAENVHLYAEPFPLVSSG